MKKSLLTVLLLFLSISVFRTQNGYDHVPGQVIVMLKPGATLENALKEASVSLAGGLTLNQTLSKRMQIFLLDFNSSHNENSVLEKLRNNSSIAIAQFNHFVYERTTFPNDTYFGSMWALDNTGQSGGTIDADIDAPEAWDITTGGLTATGDTIVVAVIDGGFQISHTDINFWKNYGEIPSNSIDDDGNGYVDDVNGWNAYNNNGSITTSSHGTHVSGTIGAKGNNGSGTTGISWNVKVMAVQGSSNTEATVVNAYSYVYDNRLLYNQTNGAKGAFIVATNSSFGVDNGQPANYPLWCAMYDSLGAVGILSAAATANQNWDIDVTGDIPTACVSQFMIAVTNTTRYDQKYSSAGYGDTTIDLGAPGTTIYSTVPTNTWSMSSWTGTSMATPHVAGTIGLMYAAACQQFITDYKADPATKALMMRNYLLNGVDTLGALNGLCATNGRLNANNALLNVQSYSSCPIVPQSIPETLNKMEMTGIFPNPTNQWVEIQYISNEDNFDVVVKDIIGKTVRIQSRTNHKGINQHKVDLSELPAGVYMIGLEGRKGQSGFKKVVKLD